MRESGGHEENGIVFDQHYTDSLLKLVLPKGEYRSLFSTRRSLPRQDVLLSLVLFGKAYLQRPYWLRDFDRSTLGPLVDEGLIEFVGHRAYGKAMQPLGVLLNVAAESHYLATLPRVLPIDPISGGYVEDSRVDLERHINYSDRAKDVEVALRPFLYSEPLIRAATRHVRHDGASVVHDLASVGTGSRLSGLVRAAAPPLPVRVRFSELVNELVVVRETTDPYEALQAAGYDDDLSIGRKAAEELRLDLERHGMLVLATIAARATEAFAVERGVPIKTAAKGEGAVVDRSVGMDAYQLFKVQVKSLRYPMLETVDDVRRLRDDKNLARYREVLFGYCRSMRNELEAGRVAVLKKFEHDVRLAANALLKKARGRERFDTVSFWLSFPLVALGVLLGIPLDDLVLLPASSYARAASRRGKEQLSWIAFGRS